MIDPTPTDEAPNIPFPARRDYYVAFWVSQLLSPPVLGLTGALLVGAALRTVWGAVWLYVLLAAVLPTIYVLWLLRIGEVSDFHLNRREERTKPTLATLLGTLLAVVAMWLVNAPAILKVLAVANSVQGLLFYLITLRWKVSAHSAAAAAVAVLALLMFGAPVWPIALLVPVVMWARVRLRRHTLAQTLVGMVLGGGTLALAYVVMTTTGLA